MKPFDQIVLTRKELRRLKSLANANDGLPSCREDASLRKANLISYIQYSVEDPGKTLYSSIEQSGNDYLRFLKDRHQQNTIHAWEFWIGILIALAGLIISLLSFES